MKLLARVVAPRQVVGAVGVVFNNTGQVLLAEHVFRTDFPWGLPGGWVEVREDPAEAVRREFAEELGIQVEVQHLLLSEPVDLAARSTAPRHLGLAFYCHLIAGEMTPTFEILSVTWADPLDMTYTLAPFQRKAILKAKQVFDHEQQEQHAALSLPRLK